MRLAHRRIAYEDQFDVRVGSIQRTVPVRLVLASGVFLLVGGHIFLFFFLWLLFLFLLDIG